MDARHLALAIATAMATASVSHAAPTNVFGSTVTVNAMYARNHGEGSDDTMANQGFFFVTGSTFTYSCPNIAGASATSPTLLFIPKLDPSPSAQLQNPVPENPAYRDYVNAVMLAFVNGRQVGVYVDGCITLKAGTYVPKVVGLDVY